MITCEVCGSTLNGPTLDLGSHPLCDDLNLIGKKVDDTLYRQVIKLCSKCLTAHQLYPVKKELLFRPEYHYRSYLTNDVLMGMSELVTKKIELVKHISKPIVLDIGCNDGSLLQIFKNHGDFFTIGVDPTDAILSLPSEIDLKIKGFFNSDIANSILKTIGHPNIITFTNVFAHIEDLPSLIDALKILIGGETILIIENHYLGSILENSQFDTFYHEHPRTYSARSFFYIANSLGMTIIDLEFPKRYGGNIRVTMTQSENGIEKDFSENYIESEDNLVQKFEKLGDVFREWKMSALPILKSLILKGPIYGKSLPGRAVMLISALGITSKEMPMLFEKANSPKIGFCIPGTDIEILPDEKLLELQKGVVIVWAWHIAEEVCLYLEEMGYRGEIWVPLPKFKLYRIIE